MAFKNLKLQKFSHINDAGQDYSGRFQIQIDDETGEFRIQVPDELISTFKRLKYPLNGSSKSKTKFTYSYAKSLSDVKGNMIKAIRDFMKCEETTEIVIAYKYKSETMYFKTIEGTILPNNVDGQEGSWINRKNSCSFSKEGMGINLIVQVFERTIFKRDSGVSVKYTHYCHRKGVDPTNHFSDKEFNSEIADRLDSYQMAGGLIMDLKFSHEYNVEDISKAGAINIIPFTDEAGAFFCSVLDGICLLSDKFSSFFNQEPDEVSHYINNGGDNLLEYKRNSDE